MDTEMRETDSHLLKIWFVVYMFIGAQTSYLLAPFIGKAGEFKLIASEKGDFFSFLVKTIQDMFFVSQ